MMELRHLRYFVAVAEEMNFRRAAERLFMEQPPLSRQIQQLEGEIGAPLFLRVKRQIALTAAGRAFLDEARRTLAQADKAILAARQARQAEERHLTVGVCFCIDHAFQQFDNHFNTTVQTFRQEHPDISLTLAETCSSVQSRALLERQIDVGLLQIPVASAALDSHCLLQEPLLLAMPQDHPLARRQIIPLAALASEDFLLFPEQIYPVLHQEIMAACASAGFRPRVVQEVLTTQTQIRLVGAGVGVTFAGTSMMGTTSGVVFRPVEDFPITLRLSVAWRRDYMSRSEAEFVGLAKHCFAKPPSAHLIHSTAS